MSKIEEYRTVLEEITNWDDFLLENSGLPGRRANIELARAAALEGDRELFERYLTYTPERAPTNSQYEFLPFCGVLGYGRLLSEDDLSLLPSLRRCANDPRWRIREAVAMALQMLGRRDMERLIREMEDWSWGSLLEKRAAAAALCEPFLLGDERQAEKVLQILDEITSSLGDVEERKSENIKALRKGLGYCWSVAVVANPGAGKPLMEKWMGSNDKDIVWIMKENLKKKRLARMDAEWVGDCKQMIL
ncbi:hypothetical protein ACFLV7_10380 [Chloroflexota bacterium]